MRGREKIVVKEKRRNDTKRKERVIQSEKEKIIAWRENYIVGASERERERV